MQRIDVLPYPAVERPRPVRCISPLPGTVVASTFAVGDTVRRRGARGARGDEDGAHRPRAPTRGVVSEKLDVGVGQPGRHRRGDVLVLLADEPTRRAGPHPTRTGRDPQAWGCTTMRVAGPVGAPGPVERCRAGSSRPDHLADARRGVQLAGADRVERAVPVDHARTAGEADAHALLRCRGHRELVARVVTARGEDAGEVRCSRRRSTAACRERRRTRRRPAASWRPSLAGRALRHTSNGDRSAGSTSTRAPNVAASSRRSGLRSDTMIGAIPRAESRGHRGQSDRTGAEHDRDLAVDDLRDAASRTPPTANGSTSATRVVGDVVGHRACELLAQQEELAEAPGRAGMLARSPSSSSVAAAPGGW